MLQHYYVRIRRGGIYVGSADSDLRHRRRRALFPCRHWRISNSSEVADGGIKVVTVIWSSGQTTL
jgi:hypothetical protein